MTGVVATADDRSEDGAGGALSSSVRAALDELWRYFGMQFLLWEAEPGCLVFPCDAHPPGDEALSSALVQTFGRSVRPPFIRYEDCAVFRWLARGKCAIGSTGFSQVILADVVRAMSSAIDAKDPYTCGHSDRVARFSVKLARQLGWPHERLTDIYMAGLLHDIGKIGIDERLLRKPEPLTHGEYERIKLHPLLGYRMLTGIDPLSTVLPAVLYHHEQWDGGGYPEGLVAEQIPEIARIIAVADAHDAMSSDRPYRGGMPVEAVHRVFAEGTAVFWDPRVMHAYFQLQRRAIPRQSRPAEQPWVIPEWQGRPNGLPAEPRSEWDGMITHRVSEGIYILPR